MRKHYRDAALRSIKILVNKIVKKAKTRTVAEDNDNALAKELVAEALIDLNREVKHMANVVRDNLLTQFDTTKGFGLKFDVDIDVDIIKTTPVVYHRSFERRVIFNIEACKTMGDVERELNQLQNALSLNIVDSRDFIKSYNEKQYLTEV